MPLSWGFGRMHSEFVLTDAQRFVLNVVEQGPVSFAQATTSYAEQYPEGAHGGDGFKKAAVALLCRGLVCADGEDLVITIAGRAALAGCLFSLPAREGFRLHE